MSNIEEDIKRCKKLTEPQNANWIGISNQFAIAHLIDKIKELEEHLKKYYNGELYTAKQLKNIEENQKKYFINKQKVKEIFDRLHISDIEPWSFYKVSGDILFDLKKLLEDK